MTGETGQEAPSRANEEFLGRDQIAVRNSYATNFGRFYCQECNEVLEVDSDDKILVHEHTSDIYYKGFLADSLNKKLMAAIAQPIDAELLRGANDLDDDGYKPVSALTREELLDETLGYMIHDDFHSLECYHDGDGWNEPYSDEWSCGCDANKEDEDWEHHWDGVGWVQTDRECSNRPSTDEVYRSWVQHVRDEQEYYR